MANHVLLKSTLLAACAHFSAILAYQPHPLYSLFLLTCLSSSVANHYFTTRYIRIADRIIISAAVPVTYAVLNDKDVPNWLLLGPAAAALTYVAAKSYKKVGIHVAAHILITVTNIGVIRSCSFFNSNTQRS